ncbi:amino acid transporter AVT1C [Chelonus insularis]|uniref:amino acid transporter AVT1C n=1 Tax=Chelonus insularis TaxID=460826 RepID=UPI00158C5D0C|nr:amino acid transporter AVT1C [Chelonus insularis]
MITERTFLLKNQVNSGLTVLFATLCIIDIFGVFPIIALPHAIIQCGLLGIPLVMVVIFLQIYTASLLGKSWIIATYLDPQIARKNRYPLAAVTELTLGRKMRTLVTFLLDLTVFGCGIPNLLVASQNLQLFGLKVSNNQFDLSFCYWLLVVGVLLCPLMWLGSPRDMKSLATCSTLAVITTSILIWWGIITDDRTLETIPVPTAPTWDKFISGYGMLAFQFDVHPTLMTIQVDMKRPNDINKAVVLSFLFSGLLFGVTAGLSAWKYQGSVTANILQISPPGLPSRAAILFSALQLIFSSVIGHAALFLHLEDQLHVRRTFGWKRCAMRSAVVFLGVAIGESVPRFDIVMALIGGTLTGPLVFILPPIMYARAKRLKETISNRIATPEIFSATERRYGEDLVSDPRAHSQSIYYDLLSENEDNEEKSDDNNYNDNKLIIEQNAEATTSFIDATQPEKLYKTKTTQSLIKVEVNRFNLFFEQLMNWFGYFVVIIGILITISSTYINIKNTIKFVKFTPPCIINASAQMF